MSTFQGLKKRHTFIVRIISMCTISSSDKFENSPVLDASSWKCQFSKRFTFDLKLYTMIMAVGRSNTIMPSMACDPPNGEMIIHSWMHNVCSRSQSFFCSSLSLSLPFTFLARSATDFCVTHLVTILNRVHLKSPY